MVELRNAVASWYVAIRMISIIGLLSVLVYLAIRMMLSGVAADKAKYKKMLMSWLVAMCMLFFLHYFMSFVMTISETITGFLSTNGDTSISVNVGDGETEFGTNIIGLVRFQVQHTDAMFKIAYMVIYIMMIFYTLKFTWVYLKRMVSMAFLTLIAPLIALTYPIDKAGDGKSQGFDMWLKEYVYNALVQPLHCLIYIVFATATIELSKTNPLIAIIIFPLMGYAEKFLKSLLGFTKASGGTQASMAGAVGAHALGTMVGNLAKRGRSGTGKEKPRTKEVPKGTDVTVGAPGALDDADYGYDANDLTFPGDTQGQNENGQQGGLPEGQNGNDPGGQVPPEGEQNGNADVNGIPTEQTDEYRDYMQNILDDPDASEEDKEFAQQQLDNYQNAQQQWQEGNTEEPSETTLPPANEPATIGEAIGQDFTRLKGAMGRTAGGIKDGLKTGIGNTIRFAKDKDYRQGKIEQAGNTLANKMDNVQDRANAAALSGYKRMKQNIRGVASAAPALGYKAAKGTLNMGIRAAGAGVRGVAAGTVGAAVWGASAVMTGDLSQATTLATTAAGGTYYGLGKAGNIGKGARERAVEDFEVKHNLSTDVKSAFERGKYGSEAQARNVREQREWEHSAEFNQFLRGKYQNKSKEEMEKCRDAMVAYHKLGVKDNEQAFKLYKAEQAAQDRLQEIGGKRPTRREMVAAMKTVKDSSERVWTGDDKARQGKKQSVMKGFSGTNEEKEKKAARRMGLAQIIYDNGAK